MDTPFARTPRGKISLTRIQAQGPHEKPKNITLHVSFARLFDFLVYLQDPDKHRACPTAGAAAVKVHMVGATDSSDNEMADGHADGANHKHGLSA